jgi:hypothetical protein
MPEPTPSPASSVPATPDVGSTATNAGSPASDSSLESTIDSLLASPTEETPGDGQAAQQSQPDVTSTSPQAEDAVVQAAEDPADLPDDEDDTDLDAGIADTAKTANLLDLKQPRGKRIYGAYKQYKAISESLGRELTVEDAKQHMEAFTDKVLMEHEFTSGEPASQLNFINFWNNTDPQAFAGVAAQLPEYLATQNQQAYNQMALPVVQRYINHMYVRAKQETDPNKQKAMLYMARMADWDLNDSYKSDDQLPNAPSAVAQQTTWVQQQLGQLQAQQAQQQAYQVNQWNQNLDSANNSALNAEISKIMEPAKANLPQRLFKAAEKEFAEAVREHLAKDVEGERLATVQRQQAQRRMSSDDIASLSSQYAQRASRAVRSLAPKLLKELGVQAKAASTAQHTALAASTAAGKAPNGAGAPVQQSIVPGQRQYASKSEQMESMLDGLLGVKK